MEIITKNAKETKKLAYEVAKKLKGGEILLLSGNLGSGKTTFTQGLAEGLEVKDRVLSPSYVLMRHHKIQNSERGIKNLVHVDLYRLSGAEEVETLGIEELLGQKENVTVIEWAEKAQDTFGKDTLQINFKYEKGNNRRITLDERIKYEPNN